MERRQALKQKVKTGYSIFSFNFGSVKKRSPYKIPMSFSRKIKKSARKNATAKGGFMSYLRDRKLKQQMAKKQQARNASTINPMLQPHQIVPSISGPTNSENSPVHENTTNINKLITESNESIKPFNGKPPTYVEQPISPEQLVVGIQSVQIKRELEKGEKIQTAIEVVADIADAAQALLPDILKAAGIIGGVAASATGIGLPIVIGVAMTVAAVMRAVNQSIQIRATLNDHFNKLLFIIKNFAVIQQTLEFLEIDVPRIEGRSVTYLKRHITLSDAFQEALVEYNILVESQRGPDVLGKSRLGRIFKKTKHKLSKLITAGRVLDRINALFLEVERLYYHEVAKFTTLMFFNLENFNKIKEIVKSGKRYEKLASFDYSILDKAGSKRATCDRKIKEKGEEIDEEICVLTPEELAIELKQDLEMLYSIVKREDVEKAEDVLKVMTEGTAEITERARKQHAEDIARAPDVSKVRAGDIVRVAAGVARATVQTASSVSAIGDGFQAAQMSSNISGLQSNVQKLQPASEGGARRKRSRSKKTHQRKTRKHRK